MATVQAISVERKGRVLPRSAPVLTTVATTNRRLERFVSIARKQLSASTLDLLTTRKRLLMRCCLSLNEAGFTYGEIAELLGDRDIGARDRIRMRCNRARKVDKGR